MHEYPRIFFTAAEYDYAWNFSYTPGLIILAGKE